MYDLKPQARPYAKAAFLAAVEEGQINEMFGESETATRREFTTEERENGEL